MRATVLFLLFASTTAAADKPADRARGFVLAQLAAISKGDDAAVKATFAPDAVLLGGIGTDAAVSKVEHADFQHHLMSGSPHDAFKKTAIKSLVAGGDDTVVWFTAELVTTYHGMDHDGQGDGPNARRVTRLTEVITPHGASWKAVAGVFAQPAATDGYTKPSPEKIGNPTKAATLAPLLASPSALAAALSTDRNTFVLGTDARERGVGPAAAKKLLGRWSKLGLRIEGSVREVATRTYAFAQASVSFAKPDKSDKTKTVTYGMTALVIAVPVGAEWRVVGVHYANR